ncbi:MAG: arsenate reductase family protein [Campylobacterales bacterium]|nr:arsenate reductase family protein [Campylobacterales bacterium]
MTIYGIKTCGSVKKAFSFFKEKGTEYEFFDFKKDSVDEEKIREWLKQVDLKILLNNKGTKYRTLGLSKMDLSDEEKIQWLVKENMLIKRPVIEFDGKVIIGFNEEEYKDIF